MTIDVSQESQSVDFKSGLDLSSGRDWCELVKDIVAMANSGGGRIIIGLDDNGIPVKSDITAVLSLDPASVTDKIYRYTGVQFSGFAINEAHKDGERVAIIVVSSSAGSPIVFTKPGTYQAEDGRQQKTAFGSGTVYFRHGAKSEPGTTADLREFLEREIAIRREEWLGNIRKVIEAPPGSSVAVVRAEASPVLLPEGSPVRLVDDPTAPVLGRLHPDISHPHRLIDVVKVLNGRLAGRGAVTSFYIQCVRQVYHVDSNPTFLYKMKGVSPRYSDAFIEWLEKQFNEDKAFFMNVRIAFQRSKMPELIPVEGAGSETVPTQTGLPLTQ